MRKRVSAKRRLRRLEPGKPSELLIHIEDLPPKLDHAVIHARVSKGDNKLHLLRYEEFLTELVTSRGHQVLHVNREVAGGRVAEDCMHWRSKLIQSIETARGHPKAYVLACSMCRFIRHQEMNKHNQGALPTHQDFECLRSWAMGVALVTAWHPDLDWKEVKRLQAKLFYNGKGGRPKKHRPGDTKRQTMLNRSKVFWFRTVMGLSFQQIADLLGTHKNQVVRWWKQQC